MPITSVKTLTRVKTHQATRRAQGLCVQCGKPAKPKPSGGFYRKCYVHKESERALRYTNRVPRLAGDETEETETAVIEAVRLDDLPLDMGESWEALKAEMAEARKPNRIVIHKLCSGCGQTGRHTPACPRISSVSRVKNRGNHVRSQNTDTSAPRRGIG
jgi:ferredoxin